MSKDKMRDKTKTLKEFYNKFWDEKNTKQQELHENWFFFKPARNYAHKVIGDLKDKKVLEIGPGRGNDAAIFLEKGAKLTCIDISLKSIDILKKKLKEKVKTFQMDAHKLKFKDDSFDVVYANNLLMFVNPERVVKECRRVLVNDGKFIIFEPLKYNPFIFVYRCLFSVFSDVAKFISLRDIENLSKCFRKSHHKEFFVFSPVALLTRKVSFFYNFLCPILQNFDKLMLKIPFLRRFAWITVAVFIK